jgi:hypothetical protein
MGDRLLWFDSPNGTDDTASLYGAANWLTDHGGGTIVLEPGIWNGANLPIRNGITWRGFGQNQTIVRLPNGASGDVFHGDNVDALLGTETIGGPRDWGIENLTVDGNKANCPNGASGIRVYGCRFKLADLVVRNCHGNGIVTEWAHNPGDPDSYAAMESFWTNIRVCRNDQTGIIHNGPHDTHWANVLSYENGGGGYTTSDGFEIGFKGSGLQAVNVHAFGVTQRRAWWIKAGECQLANCEGEGASDCQLLLEANGLILRGGNWFTIDPGLALVGIRVGSPSTRCFGVNIDTHFSTITRAAFDFVNDGGGMYRAEMFMPTGSIYTGTPNPESVLDFRKTPSPATRVRVGT